MSVDDSWLDGKWTENEDVVIKKYLHELYTTKNIIGKIDVADYTINLFDLLCEQSILTTNFDKNTRIKETLDGIDGIIC